METRGAYRMTPSTLSPAVRRLFQAKEYRFQFGMRRAESGWFDLSASPASVLAERRHWLAAETANCLVWRPEAAPALAETLRLFPGLPNGFAGDAETLGADDCRRLGELWEPDFLLLRRAGDGEFRLAGGCVCFPSAWRVTEKLGEVVHTIHEPVPTLNQELGERIRRFLNQLQPGQIFERENWGLAAHGELNAHPDLGLPRLGPGTPLSEVWLRVEHQAFVALPECGGILFIIRLVVHPVSDVLAEPDSARDFVRMLASMPEDIAGYKGIGAARENLLNQLARVVPGP